MNRKDKIEKIIINRQIINFNEYLHTLYNNVSTYLSLIEKSIENDDSSMYYKCDLAKAEVNRDAKMLLNLLQSYSIFIEYSDYDILEDTLLFFTDTDFNEDEAYNQISILQNCISEYKKYFMKSVNESLTENNIKSNLRW